MDRLRTGIYSDTSELARVIGALSGHGAFVFLHELSLAIAISFFDIVAACSKLTSSSTFSRRFASYEVGL
jgi:hypothetical protein